MVTSSFTLLLFLLLSSEPPVKLSRPKKMPNTLEVGAGSPLVLEVEVSRPSAEVKWLVNGKGIEEEGKVNFVAEGLVRQLTIQTATLEDSGIYSCYIAEDQVDFEVHVSGTKESQLEPHVQLCFVFEFATIL